MRRGASCRPGGATERSPVMDRQVSETRAALFRGDSAPSCLFAFLSDPLRARTGVAGMMSESAELVRYCDPAPSDTL